MTARRLGAALVAISTVVAMGSMTAALAATTYATYYLDADGLPFASLTTSSPPGGALPNYDPGRDPDAEGLVLKKSDKGFAETNIEKYQQWGRDASGLTVDGAVILRVWAAMKDFRADKTGQFTAYLLDCTSSCSILGSTVVTRPRGAGFSEAVVDFPSLSLKFDPGHSLAVRIIVDKQSEEDMWFAYHTSTYPSRLLVPLPPPPTTTTTTTKPTTTSTSKPTTTSTSKPTTSTTKPTTTTTATLVTTTTVAGEPTTTVGGSTTTIPTTTTTSTSGQGVAVPTTTLPPVADARPLGAATEKSGLVVESAGSEAFASDVFDGTRRLSPQEGLMVSFLSAAETVQSQLLASAALGGLGAILLIFGTRRRIEKSG